MTTLVAYTMEIDDVELAANQLADSLGQQGTLEKNRCGLLYYDFEMRGDLLAQKLEQKLGLPIVGSSCIAMLEGREGYHDMSAMLTVYTADDCEFSVAVSDSMDGEGQAELVKQAYESAARTMSCPVGLVILLAPGNPGIQTDRCLQVLSEVSGHAPILGGMPSGTEQGNQTVLHNGGYSGDRIVMVLIGGNIRPVCAIANVVAHFSHQRQGTITGARNGRLYQVNNRPFTEYLSSYGANLENSEEAVRQVFYQKYPLLVTDGEKEADGVPVVRILSHVNFQEGYGESLARFPQEGEVSLVILRREEIGQTVEAGLDELLEKIRDNTTGGYTYSTVFCVSCAARHVSMTPFHDLEGRVIAGRLPDSLRLSGFYSHGEICPTSIKDGKARNSLHNASIVFCAF